MFMQSHYLKARSLRTSEEYDAFIEECFDMEKTFYLPSDHYKNVIAYLLFCNFVPIDERDDSMQSAFAKTSEYLVNFIKQQKTTVQVCPVTFKQGDIVWNCETCQRDATCVQCASCFRDANHEGHKVYFTAVSANGGGCCDCGDAAAWNAKGFCAKHGKNDQASLPPELRNSAVLVFSSLFRWMLKICLREYPLELSSVNNNNNKTFASSLDEERKEKLALLESIKFRTKETSEYPEKMQAKIRTAKIISTVLSQVVYLAEGSDGLVQVISEILTDARSVHAYFTKRQTDDEVGVKMELAESLPGSESYMLSSFVELDTYLPENVQIALHVLLMRLLANLDFKEKYALVFSRKYFKCIVEYVSLDAYYQNTVHQYKGDFVDEDTNGEMLRSIFTLSIQFLNRSEFVEMLSFGNTMFLKTLLDSLDVVLAFHQPKKWEPLDVEAPPIVSRIYLIVLQDLRYVFQSEAVCVYLAENHDLFSQWLGVLRRIEGMDERIGVKEGDAVEVGEMEALQSCARD